MISQKSQILRPFFNEPSVNFWKFGFKRTANTTLGTYVHEGTAIRTLSVIVKKFVFTLLSKQWTPCKKLLLRHFPMPLWGSLPYRRKIKTEKKACSSLLCTRMIWRNGWIEVQTFSGMNVSETTIQTTTHPKCMFFQKLFFKSSLLLNG